MLVSQAGRSPGSWAYQKMLVPEDKTFTACVCAVVLPAGEANARLVGFKDSCCAEAKPASAAIRMAIAAARAAKPAQRRNADEDDLVITCLLPCQTILVY